MGFVHTGSQASIACFEEKQTNKQKEEKQKYERKPRNKKVLQKKKKTTKRNDHSQFQINK